MFQFICELIGIGAIWALFIFVTLVACVLYIPFGIAFYIFGGIWILIAAWIMWASFSVEGFDKTVFKYTMIMLVVGLAFVLAGYCCGNAHIAGLIRSVFSFLK